MQSAIEYAAIPTINLTPLFLVTNPLTNSSKVRHTLQVKRPILIINFLPVSVFLRFSGDVSLHLLAFVSKSYLD